MMKLAAVGVITALLSVFTMLKNVQAKCGNVPGYIYIIEERTTGADAGTLYKAGGVEGNSTEVDKHVSDLQTGNSRHLIIRERYSIDNCHDAERDVFAAIKDYSVDFGGGTEWYNVTNYDKFKDAIKSAIVSHKGPSKDIDNNSQKMKHLMKMLLSWISG